jgi:hypothetical protein
MMTGNICKGLHSPLCCLSLTVCIRVALMRPLMGSLRKYRTRVGVHVCAMPLPVGMCACMCAPCEYARLYVCVHVCTCVCCVCACTCVCGCVCRCIRGWYRTQAHTGMSIDTVVFAVITACPSAVLSGDGMLSGIEMVPVGVLTVAGGRMKGTATGVGPARAAFWACMLNLWPHRKHRHCWSNEY